MNKNIQIIPAVMPDDFDDLKFKIQRVRKLVNMVQIDVMDGVFTPNSTWPYVNSRKEWKRIKLQDEGMPFWEDVSFEIDLMVANPEDKYQEWIDAGVSRLIFHYDSLNDKDDLEIFRKIKEETDVEIGLAITPNTENEVLEKFLETIDFVQFMGIEKVGFQGSSFSENVFNKIKDFKSKHSDFIVSVDGGVNFDNVKKLSEVGVDRLVSGTALYSAEEIDEALNEMISTSNV